MDMSSLTFRRFALGFGVVVSILCSQANAQEEKESPFCRTFDHTSEDVRLKTLVIQVKPQGAGTPDPDLLAKFKFSDTLQNILKRANSAQKPDALISTMIESFRTADGEERQPRSHLRMKLSGRPGEAKLKATDMVADQADDGFVPVGFFNRFDLANFEAGHCGEARIVFAKKRQQQSSRRMLVIFEGKVTPKLSDDDDASITESDCRPVAEFWASLAGIEGANRAETLRKFYFEGDMGNFGRLPVPPMSFENLGGSNRGQVRGNLFVDGLWQLREWLIRKHGDRLSFDIVTVKENPLTEFYDSAKASSLLDPVRGAEELKDFQKTFSEKMLESLVSNNAVGSGNAVRALPTEIQMVHGFGFGSGLTAQFDEFESTSQLDSDIPKADGTFAKNIDDSRKRLGSNLTTGQIVNRATALTCHGCHQPEGATRPGNFRLEISSNVFWPKTQLNFVHIDEDSRLSEALTTSFLPFRAALMKDHFCRTLTMTPNEQIVLNDILRKAAPAALPLSTTSLRTLRQEFDAATTPTQRSVLQEAINDEQIRRRRAERSLPGSLWPFRRTH